MQGQIQTGDVEVCITSIASDDQGIDIGKTKDVGQTTVQVDPLDCSHAIVTVTNAYPCYENYIHFTMLVGGTVPVRLQDVTIINPNPCIEVLGWDSWGEQRHPGERSDNTMWFHVLQCADQNTTYSFEVEFLYVQYNEFDPTIGP